MLANRATALRRLEHHSLLTPARLFSHKFITPNRQALFAVSTLCLFTYGFAAFNHTFSGDDWGAVIQDGYMYDWAISIGRPLHLLTWILGGDNYLAPAFTLTLMILALLITGLTISVLLQLRGQLNVFIFLSLLVLCPIWAEHINFKLNHLAVALAAVSATGAAYLIWQATVTDLYDRLKPLRSALYLLTAGFLLAVAAASRQEMVVFSLAATLLIALRHAPNSMHPARTTLLIGSGALLAATISLVIYAGLVMLTRHAFDVSLPAPDSPYRISGSLIRGSEDLTLTFERFQIYFRQFLYQGQHLIPPIVKYVFLGNLVLLLVGIYYNAHQKYQSTRRALLVALVSCAIISALLILPWTLGLIRTPNSYRYSGIVAISLVFAGIIVLSIEQQDNHLLRSIGQVAALLVVLVFFFQSNLASSVTYNVNRRDFAIVNRILSRLESDHQFERLWSREYFDVIFVGNPSVYKRRPFVAPPSSPPMDSSIIECGAFNCQHGRINNISYFIQYGTTHIRWRPAANLSDTRKARILEETKKMSRWPSSGALKRISDSEVILKF